MFYPFDYIDHRRDCKRKQDARSSKIAALPQSYLYPLTSSERSILSQPIGSLVADVRSQAVNPVDILRTYGKVAIKAQEKSNCLTEILFPDAENWIEHGDINLQGPLAGIPVSLKDSIGVGGFDVSVGYSSKSNKPWPADGVLVRLLKEAGAIPFVKTNLPITLLSFESANDLWGRTKNPHNTDYSPGGSTGGEAALLAFGGSRIGIGSDVAGSVRAPAHFSGCYSLRCSIGRWPKAGYDTSMPGQEGIPSVFSPMARTLDDLTYFTREFIKMKPWRLDHTVHPLDWRDGIEQEYKDKKVLNVGILRTDEVVEPSPACARALDLVASALRSEGHIVKDILPPVSASPYLGLQIASQLLNADGCSTFRRWFRTGEWSDAGAAQMSFYMDLPRPLKYLYYLWVRYIKGDAVWAGLLRHWSPKTAEENWRLVNRREVYKATWHQWWNDQGELDFLITPPNATPAVPHNGMHDAVSSCGYTFLFNLLDYTAGIIPVCHVDRVLDKLPSSFSFKKLNGVAKGAYKHYDPIKMDGLPVGVQIVGRRLEEEKVLAVMKRVEDALDKKGVKYPLLEVD